MILSLFLPSLNVSNYHIADSIMKKLLILTQCKNRKYLYYLFDDMKPVYVNSCMIQQMGFTCPFPHATCADCAFDPLVWQEGLNLVPKDYIGLCNQRVIRVAHNLDR